MTDAVRLVTPCLRYEAQYYGVQSEFAAHGEEPTFGLHLVGSDFASVLLAIHDWACGVALPPGEGRRAVYWLVRFSTTVLLAATQTRPRRRRRIECRFGSRYLGFTRSNRRVPDWQGR